MPAKIDNRTRLIHAAERMTYAHGFRQATLADIAREANVPLGNVYYYFKTKEDIGAAVIERLLAEVRATLAAFDAAGSPKQRLYACVDKVAATKGVVARSGCPVGSLSTELHKEPGALAEAATALFEEQLTWMEAQFRALGRADARRLSAHLLASLQGISVLAHAFAEPDLIASEADHLKKWIRSL